MLSLSFFLMILSYWLFLTGVVFLSGSFISRAVVTSPSGADVCMVKEKGRCFGDISSFYIFVSALITFLLNIFHLVFHISYMTETPLGEVFSIIPVFLKKTKYGNLSILRIVILALLLLNTFILIRKPRRWSLISGILLSLILLISLSMTSHQAQEGYLKIPFFIDILHITSISLWIGGIFFIRFCYGFFLKDEGRDLYRIFLIMIKRFSNLATYSVYLAGLTGIILGIIRIKGLSVLIETAYGKFFAVKILFVSIILALGGINKFFIIPVLDKKAESDWTGLIKSKRHLYRFVTLEAVIGSMVLLATSFITHLSPEG